jgi:hypothetical protein
VIVYSPYITAITERLRAAGVTVTICSLPVAGRYHRDQRLVELRGSLSARTALLTLAHEAGHHEGYERFPGTETPNGTRSARRELEAYVYGWQVLRAVVAPISRAEWRAECRQAEAIARSCKAVSR